MSSGRLNRSRVDHAGLRNPQLTQFLQARLSVARDAMMADFGPALQRGPGKARAYASPPIIRPLRPEASDLREISRASWVLR